MQQQQNRSGNRRSSAMPVLLAIFISMALASACFGTVSSRDELLSDFKSLSNRLSKLEETGYSVRSVRREADRVVPLLVNGDFEKAGRAMREAAQRLDSMEREGPMAGIVHGYGEWVNIYADILQKLAFVLLSVYFLFRVRPLRELFMRSAGSLSSRKHRLIAIAAFSGIGMLAAAVGYFHYGESDWGFLDLQLVMTVLSGLTGGFVVGIPCAILAVLFRIVLGAGRFSYALILLGAAAAGGACARLELNRPMDRRMALLAGGGAALFHGIVTFWVLVELVPFSTVVSIILTLTVLEMLCVYAFVVLVLGFVSDEGRKKLERLLPEMKLKFLQAQINPHFLFNALNTIAAVCSREKAEQARGLIVKLSNYFRRIVKREDEWVTLREEFDHIDSYLEIEKARFQETLKIQKDIVLSPKGLETRIPILIIQPLVENAIRHGIRAKREGGVLEIGARENSAVVEITIKDSGGGISPEKLTEIRSDIQSGGHAKEGNGEGSGIGLLNINERLKYQFGSEYQLNIQSTLGMGTAISLKVPKRDQEEE